MFVVGNFSNKVLFNFVISGLIEIPTQLVFPYMVDKVGRTEYLSLSMLIAGIALLIASFLAKGTSLVLIGLVAKCFSHIATTLPIMYATEVFPTFIRSTAIGILRTFSNFAC